MNIKSVIPAKAGILTLHMQKRYCVYMLASKKDGVLYVGITSDLKKRIGQHKSGTIEGFTKKYHVKHLVWYECGDSPAGAIQREKQIKAWKRAWKIELIEKENHEWDDLSDEL